MRETIDALLAPGTLLRAVEAGLGLALGVLLARVAGNAVRRTMERRGSAQQAMVARRAVYYGILGLTVAGVMKQLGVDLSVLLGAAGVLTVALGFAAQTSASNLISGIFLLAERAFVVGDLIQVGGSTGQVMSIDLLSIKLRTLDNLSVRVPNEMVLKSEITNFTRYPIRRVDLRVRVDYRSDLQQAERVLLDVAAAQPLVLEEPRSEVLVRALGDGGVELQLSMWAPREQVVAVTNAAHHAILRAFADAGLAVAVAAAVSWVVPRSLVDGAAEPTPPAELPS